MEADTVDDFLAHYGIKGMKWGVNRSKGSRPISKREQKQINKRADAQKRRRVLSDKDLDGLVRRLEQEKKLKSLVDDDLRPGKTATQKLLGNVGTKVVGAVVTGLAAYGVQQALTRSGFNLADAVKYMPLKPKK